MEESQSNCCAKMFFFALNIDEVIMIDNQKWINMRVYMMKI
jgi:hypothetical protein